MRTRIDQHLVDTGRFTTRARAQAAIEAGLVRINGKVAGKASESVPPGAVIEAEAPHPYVSRGGVKLAAALDHFGFDPTGLICLDVGASTGGFTDVLLKRGAAKVVAVDTGREQLHPRLRKHPKVVSLESSDIRKIEASALPEPPAFVVIDVSFISLTLVLPPVSALVGDTAKLIALIKPQFEVGRANLDKRGIAKDATSIDAACVRISALLGDLGWQVAGLIDSPIAGGDGNREFLVGATRAL
jgi:23S rRNA (cytidine1920-2'-O)/16S rRNA (cytidine1409-2'-O)-methyltransferase